MERSALRLPDPGTVLEVANGFRRISYFLEELGITPRTAERVNDLLSQVNPRFSMEVKIHGATVCRVHYILDNLWTLKCTRTGNYGSGGILVDEAITVLSFPDSMRSNALLRRWSSLDRKKRQRAGEMMASMHGVTVELQKHALCSLTLQEINARISEMDGRFRITRNYNLSYAPDGEQMERLVTLDKGMRREANRIARGFGRATRWLNVHGDRSVILIVEEGIGKAAGFALDVNRWSHDHCICYSRNDVLYDCTIPGNYYGAHIPLDEAGRLLDVIKLAISAHS